MFLTNHLLSLTLSLLLGVSAVIAASSEHQQPGVISTSNKRQNSCPGVTPSPENTKWWRTEIEHNGTTPYGHDSTYKYYRTVTEYGADPTGIKDSSDAFNDAITSPNRTSHATSQPAYIYIPPGTYLVKKPISLLLSTFLIGDPLNLPKLVAHPSLLTASKPVVINAHLSYLEPNAATKTFYIALRNIIIDTTGIEKGKEVAGIDWSVSQGCSLSNLHLVMPRGEDNKHVGITMSQVGSGVVVGDCTFTGGGIGIQVYSQNYLFKGLVFDGCRVGISLLLSYVTVVQGGVFRNCQYGVDMGSAIGVGAVSVVDSVVEGCVAGVRIQVGDGQASVVLDNHSAKDAKGVVSLGGDVLLDGSVAPGQTWVWGKINPGGYQSGKLIPMSRPEGLLSDGKYFTMPQPQYEKYAGDQFLNIKGDSEFRVYGDNLHDDGPAINALLQQYAGCKIILFPQGIYRTNETIYIPPGSRIVGEAMSVISGAGSHFGDAENPQPVVKVGNSGEKGIAQLTDVVVSVADILPGAILVQVNMAGEKPGDVGLWNCVFRVGGTVDTMVNCPNPDPVGCKAAFSLAHITETASVYLENAWGWVADHNMDDMSLTQNIAVGRGVLVQSTSPTWFVGSSFEHCVMYQYAFNHASNLYIALQQTESPYWQGEGTQRRAPSPWEVNTAIIDPTFDNCASQGQSNNDMCYRSWAVYMSGSNSVVIHGSALWTFFNNMHDNSYEHGECDTTGGICQLNMAYIDGAKSTYWYSASTKAATNMIYDMTGGGGVNLTTQADYSGGWGGAVAAYLLDIDLPSIEDGAARNESGPGNQSTSGHENTGSRMSGMNFPVAIGLLSFLFSLI